MRGFERGSFWLALSLFATVHYSILSTRHFRSLLPSTCSVLSISSFLAREPVSLPSSGSPPLFQKIGHVFARPCARQPYCDPRGYFATLDPDQATLIRLRRTACAGPYSWPYRKGRYRGFSILLSAHTSPLRQRSRLVT